MQNSANIFDVVLFGNTAQFVSIDNMVNPADERVFPTQQPQRVAELSIIHGLLALAHVPKLQLDLLLFILVYFKLELVVVLRNLLARVEQLDELLIQQFGLLQLLLAKGHLANFVVHFW